MSIWSWVCWSFIAVCLWQEGPPDFVLRSVFNVPHAIIEKRPRDCDFLASPVGLKGCEYEHHHVFVLKDGTRWTPDTLQEPISENCRRYPLAECPRVHADAVRWYWVKVEV